MMNVERHNVQVRIDGEWYRYRYPRFRQSRKSKIHITRKRERETHIYRRKKRVRYLMCYSFNKIQILYRVTARSDLNRMI